MNLLRLSAFILAAGALALPATSALACSSEPLIGSVCIMASPYCPQGYLPADGRTMQVMQNQALYAVIGISYGGDGRTTFNLPDLRSRMVVGASAGGVPGGLTPLNPGTQRGAEQVTLTQAQVGIAPPPEKTGAVPETAGTPTVATIASNPQSPVAIVPPQLALTYCIATQGLFPIRP